MLNPPDGLDPDALAAAIAGGWDLTVASMRYLAVGFGSHHWEVADASGARWFATVDELQTKLQRAGEPLNAAYGRLAASLSVAMGLRDSGCQFVVAPVPARDGSPLVRAGDRLAVALYPFVEGQSFKWGEFPTHAHRLGVLGLIVALHTAPRTAARYALADDFTIASRDELELALGTSGDPADTGPYALAATDLIRRSAAPIRRLLARYDDLVTASRAGPPRTVLTHGEPHPGNTMRAEGCWLLIDWDTVLIAPPERDLWMLEPGDGSVLAAYAEATGVTPLPAMVELYRIRWDLADLCADFSRLRAPHTGSPDDQMSWDILRSLVAHIGE